MQPGVRIRLLSFLAAALAASAALAQAIELAAGPSTCVVDLDGARIVSFRSRGAEVLWNDAPPQKRAADWAHGGIPICWPRFGVDASGAIHGTAWRRRFTLLGRRDGPDSSEALLGFSEGDARLELSVSLSDSLSLEMKTMNAGTNALCCSFGFHPYFRVAERSKAVVDGLDGLWFDDDPSRPSPGSGVWRGPVRMEESIDRIFRLPDANRAAVVLRDAAGGRRIVVESEGASHINVWNPGAEKACPGVVPGDEWRRFVCVEPILMAAADGSPVAVPPGSSRALRITMRVSSECEVRR